MQYAPRIKVDLRYTSRVYFLGRCGRATEIARLWEEYDEFTE